MALRRQVSIGRDDAGVRAASRLREQQTRARLLADPRLSAPEREVLDTPVSHAFSIGSDEFIAGSPASVAEQTIAQCREVGAGHFLATFDRTAAREQLREAWEMFGTEVIPALRHATVN
jgi:hypothetical protein